MKGALFSVFVLFVLAFFLALLVVSSFYLFSAFDASFKNLRIEVVEPVKPAEIEGQGLKEMISSHSDNDEINDIKECIIYLEGRLKHLELGH